MIRRKLKSLLLVAFALIGFGHLTAQAEELRTEVVVISAMHMFHGQVDYYTYDDLKNILRKAEPDILALEVTQEELDERRQMEFKSEYPQAVFPVMEELGLNAVPMEPGEPLYSELVGLRKASEAALKDTAPEMNARFDAYSGALYEIMFQDYWTSPDTVNSELTDQAFAAKHALQDLVHDTRQKRAWHEWNAHFLKKIQEAAQLVSGGRVAVVVGLEHGYWLRDAIRQDDKLRLVTLEDAIR